MKKTNKKTISKGTTSGDNIANQSKVLTPHHYFQKYLETGQLDLPPAKVEPLLPCAPCPVSSFPEDTLRNPFRAVVKKKQAKMEAELRKTAREAAYKAALALEHKALEAGFRGIGGLQKQVTWWKF